MIISLLGCLDRVKPLITAMYDYMKRDYFNLRLQQFQCPLEVFIEDCLDFVRLFLSGR
jgi:hypothetical protein